MPLTDNETGNEIRDDGKEKTAKHSKIDQDLHALYHADEDTEKVMDNPKPTSVKEILNLKKPHQS